MDSYTIDRRTLLKFGASAAAGIMLSWGTAKLAVDLAVGQPHHKIAVLGSGAVGLATARLLQDHGFEVTIYTRDLPSDTTSNIAGGPWAPFTIADPDKRTSDFDAQLAQASRFSHRYFQNLVGERYGIRWLPLFMLSEETEFGLPWPWQVASEL